MIEHCIMGIDPGLSGAVAFYSPSAPDRIAVDDTPVAAGEVDAATLSARIRQMAPTVAVIELVGARPGQGVVSMFNFGRATGVVTGVVLACGVPLHRVASGRWKKHFRLDSDKENARALALRLWPTSGHFSRKKDHGRAEAALIARYGAEVILGKAGVQ